MNISQLIERKMNKKYRIPETIPKILLEIHERETLDREEFIKILEDPTNEHLRFEITVCYDHNKNKDYKIAVVAGVPNPALKEFESVINKIETSLTDKEINFILQYANERK